MRQKLFAALLAGGMLLICVACSPAGGGATPVPFVPQAATPVPTPEMTVEPMLEFAEEPTMEPVTEPTPISVTSGGEIDLSDPVVYRKLNIFLSNFSESDFGYFGNFSIDAPDYNNLVCFAYMHAEML